MPAASAFAITSGSSVRPSSSAHYNSAVCMATRQALAAACAWNLDDRLLKGVVAQWLSRCLAHIGSRS